MTKVEVEAFLKPEEIFRLDPRIRWAAFSSEEGQVLFSKMRIGVKSHTSDAEDESFMELGPLLMTSMAERLTPSEKAGKLQSIVVNLDKDSVLLMKVENGYLAISADRADAVDVFLGVAPKIRERYT